MKFSASDIQEGIKLFSESGKVAGFFAEVLKDGKVAQPYQDLIREAAKTVKPLIEEAGDWGLAYHMKHLKSVMQEFNVTPMEASQMLALKARSSMLGQAVENVNTSKKRQ